MPILSMKIPTNARYESSSKDERRLMDLAMAVIHGRVLTLIYTYRGEDVRVILFRPASREEREQYEQDSQ